MIWNAFLLALREIRNNLLRAGLTTLGIVIGVSAVILMVTLGAGANQKVTGEFASLGNNLLVLLPGQPNGPPTATVPFDIAVVEKIQREIPNLADVIPEVAVQGVIVNGNHNHNTQIDGTTNAYMHSRNWNLVAGREFSPAEMLAGKSVCILGETDRRELFGDQVPIGARIRINKISCEVIGILEPKGVSTFGQDMDELVLMPLKAVQRKIAGNTEINVIRISVDNQEDIPHAKDMIQRLMREIRHILPGQVDDFDVEDLQEISQIVQSATLILTAFLSAVAAVSLLVGGIGIMNIMLVSVTERTREIGLRVALGARSTAILRQFLIEAVVLSTGGGTIGVVLGIIGAGAIALLAHWPTSVPIASIFLALAFSAAVGVFFGYWPARKAAALDPIRALRFE